MRLMTWGPPLVVAALASALPAEGSLIYGLNLRGDNTFYTTTTDDFIGGFSTVGAADWDSFAIDMDVTATTMHAVLFDGMNSFGTVDVNTGAFNPVGLLTGPAADANVSGLSVDPVSGNWYLSAIESGIANLYVGDITTGVFDLVGDIGFGFNIDIAIDSQGNAYGHEIGTDQLLSIDLGTGAGTVIGPTGLDTNFAQGMDFDYTTDTLYATMYLGSGNGRFGTFDLGTGGFNVLQDITELDIESEMVVAEAIPGPGTLALLGVAAFGLRRRRRD